SRPTPTPTLSPYTTLFRSQTLIHTYQKACPFQGILSHRPSLNSPATAALGFVSLGPLPTRPSTKLDRAMGSPSHSLLLQGYSCRSQEHTSELESRANLV